jgi:hypothetical protein
MRLRHPRPGQDTLCRRSPARPKSVTVEELRQGRMVEFIGERRTNPDQVFAQWLEKRLGQQCDLQTRVCFNLHLSVRSKPLLVCCLMDQCDTKPRCRALALALARGPR